MNDPLGAMSKGLSSANESIQKNVKSAADSIKNNEQLKESLARAKERAAASLASASEKAGQLKESAVVNAQSLKEKNYHGKLYENIGAAMGTAANKAQDLKKGYLNQPVTKDPVTGHELNTNTGGEE